MLGSLSQIRASTAVIDKRHLNRPEIRRSIKRSTSPAIQPKKQELKGRNFLTNRFNYKCCCQGGGTRGSPAAARRPSSPPRGSCASIPSSVKPIWPGFIPEFIRRRSGKTPIGHFRFPRKWPGPASKKVRHRSLKSAPPSDAFFFLTNSGELPISTL
jgi:hypothetical protein